VSSTVRVSSGNTIQVRTGVLQGIGPVGPTGPAGPQGNIGLQGETGPAGPQGALGEFALDVRAGAAQSIATNTNTLVMYDTVIIDDYSAMQSATNFKPGAGNYYITAYTKITKQSGVNATGLRGLRILAGGVVVGGNVFGAASTLETEISVNCGLRITDPNLIITIQAIQVEGVTLQLQNSRLWICRTGSGPQGVQGIQGPIGTIGPAGPAGPQGPAGTVGNNTTTFAQLEAGTG
jgi:hypothetical protein